MAIGQGDESWENLLIQLSCEIGGDKAMLLGEGGRVEYRHSLAWNHDPECLKLYDSGYNQRDPRLHLSKLTPIGECQLGQAYIPNNAVENTEYFETINRRGDVLDSVHGIICDDSELGRRAISIQRGFRSDFFEPAEARQLKQFLPLIERTMKETWRAACLMGQMQPGKGSAVGLIDPGLTVEFFGPQNSDMSFGDDKLRLVGSRLAVRDPALKGALQLAVQQASDGWQGRVTIGNHILSFGPAPAMLAWFGKSESCAFLSVTTQPHLCRQDIEPFVAAFGLTEAEAGMIVALSISQGVQEAAMKRGVSYETARWHIKNICAKTGHSRSADLLESARVNDLSALDIR